MILEMTSLARQLSCGLDFIEEQIFGITTKHGKRLELLVTKMAEASLLSKEETTALSIVTLFHDNGLTEYIGTELNCDDKNLYKHCEIGQKNIEDLCLPIAVKDIILYHHEYADGSGCFEKKEGEILLESEIISLADHIDWHFGLGYFAENKVCEIRKFVEDNTGTLYFPRAAEAFLAVFDDELQEQLLNENIDKSLENLIPEHFMYFSNTGLMNLADFVMRIIDYHSKYTFKHSSQVANKVWLMGEFYKIGIYGCVRMYVAAAVHDIGKLAIPKTILEKPGKLSEAEFTVIKSHVVYTHDILEKIKGFEEITYLSAMHHEKLDGSGYPFGKSADELNFFSRILAAVDIYQAVSEERPYHSARNHDETMKIMWDMVDKYHLDEEIVKDIDTVMKPYSLKDVPKPVVE